MRLSSNPLKSLVTNSETLLVTPILPIECLVRSNDRLLDMIENGYTASGTPSIPDRFLGVLENVLNRDESPRTHIAASMIKPLIIDSGASHHIISDNKLIKDIEPVHGHVMIANGDRIPIRGIGKLKWILNMREFTSNFLFVKRCTTDLQCNVIFIPNDVEFQDIGSTRYHILASLC